MDQTELQDNTNYSALNKRLKVVKVVQIIYGVISIIFLVFYLLILFVGFALSIDGGNGPSPVESIVFIVTPILFVVAGVGGIVKVANITKTDANPKKSLIWVIVFNVISCLLVFPISVIWIFPLVLASLAYKSVARAEIQQA